MSTLEVVALIVVVVLAVAWYLSYTAARLHRLQTRVEGALAALDAHLVRRAEAAVELVNSGLLDPATSLIVASAAAESLDNDDTLTTLDWEESGLADREVVESGLTQALRMAIPGGDGEAMLAAGPWGPAHGGSGDGTRHLHVAGEEPEEVVRRVLDAHRRVQLSRRFYNDAVTDVQRLRRNVAVRMLRLAGHAALPRTVEFDDDISAGR